MIKQRNVYLFFSVVVVSIMLFNCTEKRTYVPAEVPANPFDTVSYGNPPMTTPVDSQSFLGLHLYIFSTTCAVPGCHDGSFEPDFRTVQSTYNTLVYHRVEKNNATNDFEYRVVPGNSTESWLHERITTDDAVLGRMPLYDTLSPREIELITNWIDDGAKDIFGNSKIIPNILPATFGCVAFEDDHNGLRLDTTRPTIIDPMILPKNKTVDIWVGLIDQDPEGTYIPAGNFTYNKYKISDHLYEFENKPEKSLLVRNASDPFMFPGPFDPPGAPNLPWFHHFKINTNDYPAGRVHYFRVYVQDENASPTEIPSDGTQIYLLTLFSFVVQ